MNDMFVTLKEAAELEKLYYETMKKRISSNPEQYIVKKEPAINGGKPRILVALSSLSTKAQVRKAQQDRAKFAELIYPEAKQERKIINFAELEACVGKEKYNQLIADANRALEIVNKYSELCERLDSKVDAATTVANGYSVSVASVYRYVEKYRKDGFQALIRLPQKFKQKRGIDRISIPESVRKVIRGEYLQEWKPKASHVYRRVLTYCKLENIEPPSYNSVRRYINDMNKNEPDKVCMGREGIEAYNKKFMMKAVRELPELANEVWEGDHHRLDAFIEYDGKAVRPWITLWYDVTTCTARGFTIAIQANGQTISLAFRHGVLKKQLPQFDVSEVRDVVLRTVARLGWLPDELESLSGWETPLYGLPKQVYIDNGEDYKSKLKKGLKCEDWDYSEQVRTLSGSLNFNVVYCTPYTPWAKGNCERFFGTVTDQFSRYLPGYCGNDNKNRPPGLKEDKMAANGELLTLEEVYMLLEFNMHYYHSTVHSTLGMTPYQRAEAAPLARTDMPDERSFDICLMDADTAVVRTTGIERFGTRGKPRWYTNELLAPYVKKTVVIRWDPNHIGELLVFEPGLTGKYICTAVNGEALKYGMAQEDVKNLRQKQARRRKELREQLKEDRTISVEKVIYERTKAGLSVISGETKHNESNISTLTGMEKAAKATKKNQKKATNNLDRLPKAANASGSIDTFDEWLINSGKGEK